MTTLFLKYRPQTFSDLVGQEAVVRTLQNALKTDRPAHAYLFVGSRGTGKTSTARLLSKGLNCLSLKDGDPCGTCDICQTTAEGSLVDVIEIDAASHTGVDNIRDLREKANFMPNIAKRKIYIIDEVHMLSKGAFNALLKTLEEPPSHTFFILATTEFDKVPETIVSRCQTFTFGRFTIDQLTERLQMICKAENFDTTPEALELIARKAEGGLRDAISLLEQISAETQSKFDAMSVRTSLGISSLDQLENFYNAIENHSPDEAFALLKEINKNGGDFRAFGHDFLNYLREKMHASMNDSQKLSKVITQIDAIEEAISKFQTSPLIELPLEIAVVKLCTGHLPQTLPKVTPKLIPTPTPPPTPQTPEKREEPKPEISKPQPSTDFVFDDNTPPLTITPENKPVKPEPTPKTQPTKVEPPKSNSAISASQIKEHLSELAESAGLASFVKKSLLTTTPHVEGNTVFFKTNATFHCNQLQKSNSAGKIEQAINKFFNTTGTEVKFKTTATPASTSHETTATIQDLEF